MDRVEVLKSLKNDQEYYTGIGKQFLSNSDVGTLLNNPTAFGTFRKDGKAFAEGRLFHQLLLEPEKAVDFPVCDTSTRTTKEYKAFVQELGVEFCMLTKEVAEVNRWVDAVRQNYSFYELIYGEGNQYEVPEVTTFHDLPWKGKADIVTPEFVVDLKTTGDINKFKYSARAYNYDSQCYIYQQLFGKPLVFLVVDKETCQLGMYKPSTEFVEYGAQKVERASQVYQRYFGQNASEDIINHYINEIL
tara:strand:- start:753 stop:1490 length:738 start_codon:yes stop_codon:yes gene_type:complete